MEPVTNARTREKACLARECGAVERGYVFDYRAMSHFIAMLAERFHKPLSSATCYNILDKFELLAEHESNTVAPHMKAKLLVTLSHCSFICVAIGRLLV